MTGGTTLQLSSQQAWSQRALNLLFCASGIIICYGAFSVFQEKITQRLFGEKKERFVYMQALVFFQCATNLLVAWYVLRRNKHKSLDNVPLRLYSMCSTSYFLAMLFSSYALEWVNYPTQVLGKSCKPIPIMLFGVLFAHKRYGLRKYFYVLLIVTGMAIFLYKPQKGSVGFQFGSGELFLCLSLAMDGFTGAVQDRIRHYHTTDKWTMMFSMNAFSSAFLALILLASGELFQFFRFVAAYPFILQQMFLFSLSGAVGQCFIFKTVTDFGPLTCSIITTLRKLFSLVFSIIIFSHPYTNRHVLGIIFVFAALILDAIDSRKSHGKAKGDEKPAATNGLLQEATAQEKEN
ncbi:hypothetical protein niasHT_027964 [Heterodera trifolii]|uniref:Solute carrier family 35 member B1 n=1 Tax=Heterodera trifolii TaxID=157864 RepID=A0ABD2KE33_9BILA